MAVGGEPPRSQPQSRFEPAEWGRIHGAYALPENEGKSYDAVLQSRRSLMANVIRRVFETPS
jgi:hypothetical protein